MGNLSRKIELEQMHNTRDIGGMVTKNGRIIKRGVFYRSGHLCRATDDDLIWVKNHVDTVMDFRSEKEIFEAPDLLPDGITYIHNPSTNRQVDGITREKKMIRTIYERYSHYTDEQALNYMRGVYKSFVEDDFVAACYTNYLKMLTDRESGRVLVHCAAGKDRAGFATILLQEILGVSRKDIIDDYMLSNEYLGAEMEYMLGTLPEDAIDRYEPILSYFYLAYPEYIESLYENIDSKYPSFMDFAKDRFGLTDENVEIIRRRYLE